MCEPSTVIAVVGLVFGAYTSNEENQTQKSVARYKAREAENRAVLTRNKGVEAERQHREKVVQLQSTQRAQLGASGVDLRSGSAADIQDDTALLGEVDALRIRQNFEDEAQSLERSAGLINVQSRAASDAARNQQIGTALTTVGEGIETSGVSSRWYSPNSAAMTTTTTGQQANLRVGSIA